MADISKLRHLFGLSDQSADGFTLLRQLINGPAVPARTTDSGGIDRARLGAPCNPRGANTEFGDAQLGGDIDCGMNFSASHQANSFGLSDAGDIGFGATKSANADVPAIAKTEASNPWTSTKFSQLMRKLMADLMKLSEFYSPNIDGIGTSAGNDGTGDINFGSSDLSSDALPLPYQSAQLTAKPPAIAYRTANFKAHAALTGDTGLGNSMAISAAPGSTYVDADPALLAEIAGREQTDPAGAAKLKELAQQPITHWLNGTPYDAQHLKEYLDKAQAAGKEGSVMFYNIPGRDNGGFSGGGAKSVGEYQAWAKQMSDVIGDRKTTVYLETDAIMLTKDQSPEKADERLKLIGDTVDVLKKNNPNATVVLNAGSAGWGNPAETASLLKRANIQNADGFFLNVAGFESTADSMRHGDAIVSELDKLGITGKRYIIDTSRNGAKIAAPAGTVEAWADPDGAASGTKPTTDQAIIQNPNVMALSWVKTPWNSDGRLSSAGAMTADYAIKLVDNARRLSIG